MFTERGRVTELVASNSGAINGLHISEDGRLFVTGANDQMVKLWLYQEGIYTHMGLGHAGAVTCCRFSPDGRHVVSCCAAGSVIVWKVSEQYITKPAPPAPSPKPQPAAAAAAAAPAAEDLRLPLADKPEKVAGDRPNRVPAAPSKVEKISAMDTCRESVVTCCPCDTARSAQPAPAPAPAPAKAPSTAASGSRKGCKAAANLPTRTTSKEFVSGSGDRK